ncbi:hypothetical protein LCGC14_2110780 [marine sediment metagenome]|uniref:ParB-like N-terminal domain-containing protein n=1 Tax=marine sediment metagenome TaxID=412755 RepID=A0A0F9H3L3_9ZZZZ
MQKLISLSRIKPNPFRDMDNYPINEQKVQALAESFAKTGYWGNLVARENGKGVELAYGHHRWITMQREMKKTAKVPLIIKDISDEDMLRIMADENIQEWATSSSIEQETVKAVVNAYADGWIELPEVKNPECGGGLRNAPGFQQATFKEIKSWDQPLKPYNAESIARFLGWMSGDQVSPRVRNALGILEAAEEMGAEEDIAEITEGLGSDVAKEVVNQIKAVREEQEDAGSKPAAAKQKAIQAGKAMAGQAKRKGKEKRGVRDMKDIAKGYKPDRKPKAPEISEYAERFSKQLDRILVECDLEKKVHQLVLYREYMKPEQKRMLQKALRGLASRCEKAAAKLDAKTVGSKVRLLEGDK